MKTIRVLIFRIFESLILIGDQLYLYAARLDHLFFISQVEFKTIQFKRKVKQYLIN